MRVRCGERRERSSSACVQGQFRGGGCVASRSLEFSGRAERKFCLRCSRRHRNVTERTGRGDEKTELSLIRCPSPSPTHRQPMIASAATARSPHRPVLIAALMIVVATAFWTRVSKLSVEAWDSPISAAAVKATDFNGTVIVLSWTDCSADDGDRHARHFTQSAAAPGRPVFTLTHNNRPTHCEGSQCV